MLPIDFEGSNIELVKPHGMTDEECMSVPAFHGFDNGGNHFFLTAWRPSKEDMEAINAGRPIMLKVLATQTPPVALYTFDENFNANT